MTIRARPVPYARPASDHQRHHGTRRCFTCSRLSRTTSPSTIWPVSSRDPLSHTTIHRHRVEARDVGAAGFVDGGTLLEWIHRAAHATATRWSGRCCVAVSLGNFHLNRPIAVGDVIDLHACLAYTGRSSMHVLVTVFSASPASAAAGQPRSAQWFSWPSTISASRLRFAHGRRKACSNSSVTVRRG